jgi:hypothetical protein
MVNLKRMLTKITESLAAIRALTFSPISNRNVTNANDAPDGIVYCRTGVTNAPENYIMLITMTCDNQKQQVAFPVSGTPTKIYSRKRSSEWSPWRSVTLS